MRISPKRSVNHSLFTTSGKLIFHSDRGNYDSLNSAPGGYKLEHYYTPTFMKCVKMCVFKSVLYMIVYALLSSQHLFSRRYVMNTGRLRSIAIQIR